MTSRPPEDRRPRLLVLASTYPRWKGDPEPGFVHELARRLCASFRVTVVTPDAPGAEPTGEMDGVHVIRYRYAPRRLQTLVHDGGILANLRRHPWKWLLLPTFVLGMMRAAWVACRDGGVDAVHAHWLVPQGVVAALVAAACKSKPKIVVTCHGADLHALGSAPMRALKRFAAKRAAAITVVSNPMVPKVRDLVDGTASVEVMPMGVDLDLFSPGGGCGRSHSELLFVGRLVGKKGVRHLLDAMPKVLESFPGTRLKIAGFGPEQGNLQRQAERLGLASRVEFLGPVPQRDLPALYRNAAALVAPFVEAADGDQEGLGLVVVEALACGCPVVTTDIPAVSEVFQGLAPPYCARAGSPDSLATEILRLLGDVGAARAHVAAMIPRLQQRFGWNAVAGGYARLLMDTVR